MTFKQIGLVLGISATRVRQLFLRSMSQLLYWVRGKIEDEQRQRDRIRALRFLSGRSG